jgi:hypothetical protein
MKDSSDVKTYSQHAAQRCPAPAREFAYTDILYPLYHNCFKTGSRNSDISTIDRKLAENWRNSPGLLLHRGLFHAILNLSEVRDMIGMLTENREEEEEETKTSKQVKGSL